MLRHFYHIIPMFNNQWKISLMINFKANFALTLEQNRINYSRIMVK